MKSIQQWIDRFAERGVRQAAQLSGRRSALAKLGSVMVGTAFALPMLPFDRSGRAHAAGPVGLDFEHNWGGTNSRDWVIFGRVAHAWVTGSEAALLEVQTSSQHFFQRPDASHVELGVLRRCQRPLTAPSRRSLSCACGPAGQNPTRESNVPRPSIDLADRER